MNKNNYTKQLISPFSQHLGFAKYLHENYKLIKFHFHVEGISGRHIQYLQAKDLLKRRKQINGFYVISDEDYLISLIYHYKDAYKNKMFSLLNNKIDCEYVKTQISTNLPSKTTNKIATHLKNKDIDSLKSMRSNIKKQILFRPVNLITASVIVFLGGLWKISRFYKKAPLIAFMGMDGAGKSTLTAESIQVLNENRISSELVYTGRGRRNIIPIQKVGKWYKNKEKNEGKKSSNQKISLKKKITYTLSSPIFTLDLILRYFIKILPKRKSKDIVITDRYATDILLMKNVPMWLKKILYFTIPKPTKIIYLYNDIDVLHIRKPNHPYDDLVRQESLFKEINKDLNPIQIKNEDIEKSKKQVCEIIFNELLKNW